jgi:acetolactate decarboxylase
MVFHRILSGLMLAALLGSLCGCRHSSPYRSSDEVFQYSTLQALLEGVYDGELECEELLTHGDLGIGTFNTLDGEMIVLDGECYQARVDGTIQRVPGGGMTPFATVTPFNEDEVLQLGQVSSLEVFTAAVDKAAPNHNLPLAFRVDGTFSYIKTRSVPAQKKPYPRLTDAAKRQKVTEIKNVTGTIVGFRLPQYLNGVNVAGYHMHFIDSKHRWGGHVLDFWAPRLRVALDPSAELRIVLPQTGEFARAGLGESKDAEVQAVERGK